MQRETYIKPVNRKYTVTSKTTGYVKLKMTVGDIPEPKQEQETYDG